MSSLSRTIKDVLYSPSTPDFLFSRYFSWKNAKDSQRLFELLGRKNSLLDQLRPGEREHWDGRIQDVIDCPDNADIPRHASAGKIEDRLLIMHNGIKVDPLSYYNYPLLHMLMVNGGVHEPQEEKIFQQTLPTLSKKGPLCMLELGAYWSFYSIWFKQQFPDAHCVMVEPDRRNLSYGKRNAALNGVDGTFIHAGIGKQVDRPRNLVTVDEICRQQGLNFIDVLHSDIQGFELDMLHGSRETLSQGKVGYAFISTHSNELHEQCRAHLETEYNFSLVASANLDESFSWDGILVMKAPDYPGIESVQISKKVKQAI